MDDMGSLNAKTPHSADVTAVVGVEADRLFGIYDYRLPLDWENRGHLSDVLLFYGDNGSGKTTLLNVIFHLLSPANNRSHRGTLSRIPFKRIRITLYDGTTVQASRAGDLTGGYYLQGERPADNRSFSASYGIREEKGFGMPAEEQAFLSFLKDLNQTLYLLSADRQIVSDILSNEPNSPELAWRAQRELEWQLQRGSEWRTRPGHLLDSNFEMRFDDPGSSAIAVTLRHLTEWVREQVLRATNRGTGSIHSTYSEIVNALVTSNPEENASDGVEPVLPMLESMATRSKELSRFGFTSPLQVEEMIQALSAASGKAPLVARVLTPYINATNARLAELEDIHQITSTFIESLNTFYRDKFVEFDINRGLAISRLDGEPIEPNWLSSGEQQLLRLFVYALTATGNKQTIFIIDEPELSLNVKWQRQLVNTLISLVANRSVQFIMATHSIELVAEHESGVVKLDSPAVPTGQQQLFDGSELQRA